MDAKIISILSAFIPQVEGFSANPYWDNRQWSWGYGTAAGFNESVKPKGQISRQQALLDAITHFTKDYNLLAPKVKTNLNANQWSAYLSFSYNEGIGNAENLLADINSKSIQLEHHFKEYVYSVGKVDTDLVDRRNREWKLFTS